MTFLKSGIMLSPLSIDRTASLVFRQSYLFHIGISLKLYQDYCIKKPCEGFAEHPRKVLYPILTFLRTHSRTMPQPEPILFLQWFLLQEIRPVHLPRSYPPSPVPLDIHPSQW